MLLSNYRGFAGSETSVRDGVFCRVTGWGRQAIPKRVSMLPRVTALGGVSASAPSSNVAVPIIAAELAQDVQAGPKILAPSTGLVKREMFPKEFVFGTATAAYQVEGAFNEGGRGLSIWDAFSKLPGKTANGDTGDVACDQYHRFEEDVKLMVDMGVTAYRFSISWSRIMPRGEGPVNLEGIQYYNRLIDCLLANGIAPYITLFHWDLPLALHQSFGGWLDEKIVKCFADYAHACFEAFGDRVKSWITFNEPLTFAVCGYGHGVHAPGRRGDSAGPQDLTADVGVGGDSASEPYIVGHNILRSHAAAVQIFRTQFQSNGGQIGISVDSDWSEPMTEDPADVAAAQRRMEFQLGWLLDPIFKGDYPLVMRKNVGSRLPTFSDREVSLLQSSLDFIGLNHYTSRWVTAGKSPARQLDRDHFRDQEVDCSVIKGEYQIGPRAASEWLFIVPWGLGKTLLWLTDRYGRPPIYITENGMDEEDNPSQPLTEALDDGDRVQYYNDYLLSVAGAIQGGADVRGYFAWSLLDNFEWAMGYTRRFGLHYIDYGDGLKRHKKRSAKWFANLLAKK